MKHNYIKNWGVYVGSFDENELRQNLDKKKIREMQEKYPKLQYINYHMVKGSGVKRMAVYICTLKDLRMKI